MLKTLLTFCLLISILLTGFSVFAQNQRELTQEDDDKKPQKRTALVIGNADYTIARKLANPSNDATDMANSLSAVGFEVVSGTNLNLKQMNDKVREFGDKLKANGGVGLFYYAGHGIQVSGRNYLIPVDAEIPREDEVDFNALNLDLIMRKMATANNGLNIVILDACRNNPFARSWSRGNDEGGLAQISAPTGTFIAYATSPDRTASDGTGRNGLYTAELLKVIKQPNMKIEDAFKQVTISVDRVSSGKQVPWTSSSLRGEFYFTKNADVVKKPFPDNNSDQTKTNPTKMVSANLYAKWDEMVRHRDLKLLAETTAFLSENPQNIIALRMRSSINFMNNFSADGKKDAVEVDNLLINPKTTEEFEIKCYAQRRLDKFDEAVNNCNQAIRLNPAFASAYYNRGYAYYFKSEYQKAIADFNKAVEIDSKFTDAISMRAATFFDIKEYDKALQDLTTTIEIDPNSTSYFAERARVFLYAKKDYERAFADLTRALELDPKSSRAYSIRGDYYDFKKETDSAIADFKKAIEFDPENVYNSYRLGQIYYNKADYASAIPLYTQAIRLAPKGKWNYYGRGISYNMSGKQDLAIADLTRALELDPNFKEAFNAKGNAYLDSKDYDRAILEYNKAIQIDAKFVYAYRNRARAYEAKGEKNLAKADQQMVEALEKQQK